MSMLSPLVMISGHLRNKVDLRSERGSRYPKEGKDLGKGLKKVLK